MKLHDQIQTLLEDTCEEPLSAAEITLLHSRPYKILCWHVEQLRKNIDDLRAENEKLKRDVVNNAPKYRSPYE